MFILRQIPWLTCVSLFLIHQWTQKFMGWKIPWADNHLDCLLCMPVFLTLLLAERRWIFQKTSLYSFSAFETSLIVIVLSLIYEEGFPRWSTAFTKDYWDYLCYGIGALFFYFFINKQKAPS